MCSKIASALNLPRSFTQSIFIFHHIPPHEDTRRDGAWESACVRVVATTMLSHCAVSAQPAPKPGSVRALVSSSLSERGPPKPEGQGARGSWILTSKVGFLQISPDNKEKPAPSAILTHELH